MKYCYENDRLHKIRFISEIEQKYLEFDYRKLMNQETIERNREMEREKERKIQYKVVEKPQEVRYIVVEKEVERENNEEMMMSDSEGPQSVYINEEPQ